MLELACQGIVGLVVLSLAAWSLGKLGAEWKAPWDRAVAISAIGALAILVGRAIWLVAGIRGG